MSSNDRGLGRGLDALFRNAAVTVPGAETSADSTPMLQVSVASASSESSRIIVLPIAALSPLANQPRKTFDEQALDELAQSIKSQGIIQPLLVRLHKTEIATIYEIVAGERRWRAASRAGLTEVPVYIKDMTEEEALTASLIENLQREDLNALEEAEAIRVLQEKLSLTQEDLASKLGKSRSAVANSLRLLSLPDQMRQALREGTLTSGHARALLSVTETEPQQCLFAAILNDNLSVRETESAATYWKKQGQFPAKIYAAVQGKPAKPSKPQVMQAAIAQLRSTIHPKANITGDAQGGRISLPYESEAQLAELLSKLGLTEYYE